jgi:tripartite-type tricarboxylate transporter receptor subunit TctC
MTIMRNVATTLILCQGSVSLAQAQSEDAQSYPSEPIHSVVAASLDPVGSTSEEFARTIAKDVDTWAAVAKAANIRIEP